MKHPRNLFIFVAWAFVGAISLSIALAAPPTHSAPTDKGGSTPVKKPAPKKPADKKAAEEAKKRALDKLRAENLDIFKNVGEFVVSLAKDNQGNIWVGTEDKGVFRFDPNAEPKKQWRQFTTKDGLGDDNGYDIACDKLGRVWVGQLNHGVAVYNGDKWRVYDVLDGPIGERIFSIATCPADGDVWMATSAGLTRYRLASDTWSYYTRAEGLPSDQASSIAFAADGEIYVGTQCDGIAISHPARSEDDTLEYKSWRTVRAPNRFGDGNRSPVPLEPMGNGLPTNLINQILVAKDGTVWAATTTGLAWSKDHGATWLFVRGKDYAAKVQGLYGGPPSGWKETSKDFAGGLILPEDYVTCVSEDDAGMIWMGFRQAGYMSLDPQTKKRVHYTMESARLNDNYVSTILPMPDGRPMISGYLGGLIRPKTGDKPISSPVGIVTPRPVVGATKCPPFPQPAKPPTLAELTMMQDELRAVKEEKYSPNRPTLIALSEDWKTQGDWLGRYGRYWAVCAAICSPSDYVWGAGWDKVSYHSQIGPNALASDSIRYWVHWLYTKDRRSLEMPPTYLHSRVLKGLTTWDIFRRQAEWDDHGEAYPQSKDGPDVYFNLQVPAGLYCMSLYDFNKDGHTGKNRFRDYRISIRQHSSSSLRDFTDFEQQEEMAKGRIRDFWGGVYKRYLVQGPTVLTVQVSRNYSHNTILAGVMLDLVEEYPLPYFHTLNEWNALSAAKEDAAIKYMANRTGVSSEPRLLSQTQVGITILEELELIRSVNPSWWATNSRRYYLALHRWYAQPPTLAKVPADAERTKKIASCQYFISLYGDWEKSQRDVGLKPARDIEKALRWDGVTYSCEGQGYGIISNYVASQREAKAP